MPSHLSSIGFPVQTEEDFERYARRAVEEGRAINAGGGRYVRWPLGMGAQLWVQVDANNRFLGLNPHFSGYARLRARLTHRITRSGGSALDGAFHGWADLGDDAESGAFPFVFDTPDYALYQSLELPAVLDVQLAAFAHELAAYPDEEAYYAAQERKPRFASQSFIPSGLFTPGGEATEPPEAYALFSGHVRDAALLTNPATGASFHWALVDTYGGAVDVVADPEVVRGPLGEGGVVRGSFWLSGRLPGYPRRRAAPNGV